MGTSVVIGPSLPVEQAQLLTQLQLPSGLEHNGWLAVEHPSYTLCKDEWTRHERAMRGGKEVECWLESFDWEQTNGTHHNARKQMLTWLPFADRFATLVIGHMMREAPKPDFGTLGEVSRHVDSALPTPAELIYFNTDGVGEDGSQWDNFWTNAARWAVATGHRFIWAHGPKEAPTNRAEEISGKRPFLESVSPLSVINWLEERGRKQFLIVRRWVRRPTITRDGVWENNVPVAEYVVLVRKGCHVFDSVYPEFSAGGWFTFDHEGNPDPEQRGSWDATGGEIPMFTLFYERMSSDSGSVAISRSGITEMVNASIAYMNLASAADFDVWDAGTSAKAIVSDDETFNLFVEKLKKGNRWVPLKPTRDANGGAIVPSITDAAGVSQQNSSAFDARMRAKRNEALEFMLNEIQIAPDSSGVARQASFTDVREPRLALMAAEIETTQNACIWALELLWGTKSRPSGSVDWPKEFKLIDPVTSAADFFTIENLAGVHSPTAGAKVLTAAAQATGLIGDDSEEKKVKAEYVKALQDQADATSALASLAGAVNDPNGTPTTPQEKPGPLAPEPLTTDIVRGSDGKVQSLVQRPTKPNAQPIKQDNSGRRNAGTKN